MDYESNEFLTDGSVSFNYDDLSYHDKIKVRALQGLDSLAASLNSISNIKAIEFQINHLNEMTSGFTDQLAAKDTEIENLTQQLSNLESTQIAALENAVASANADAALLQAEVAALKAANDSLTENFNKFKSVLTSIDHLTDEVID
jgi:chromosome segregation ATPase